MINIAQKIISSYKMVSWLMNGREMKRMHLCGCKFSHKINVLREFMYTLVLIHDLSSKISKHFSEKTDMYLQYLYDSSPKHLIYIAY